MSLKKILDQKADDERAEVAREVAKDIMESNLEDFLRELRLWRSWLIMNQDNFTPEQVSEHLRECKELVNELLLANAHE